MKKQSLTELMLCQALRLSKSIFDKRSTAIRFAGFAFEKGCVPHAPAYSGYRFWSSFQMV